MINMVNTRLIKIIATLGPAISTKGILKQMDKFVDIYRINLSHTDLYKTRQIIKIIRDINSKKVFMLDIKGPEIRTTNVNSKQVNKGDIVKIYSKPKVNEISFEYKFFKNIPEQIEIIFDNNKVTGIVLKNNKDHLEIEITQGGIIEFNKTVNFKGYEIELDFLTEKDKKDIKFGVEEGIALLAIGSIKSAEDIKKLRKYIKQTYNYEMKIIAKIETASAINNIDNIIQEADGIMIIKENLYTKINIVQLPKIQSEIIKKCNLVGKPVILATQVTHLTTKKLLSIKDEIDKIAYNIQNGVDVFMISNETAIDKYTVETVSTLDEIIRNYQKEIFLKIKWEDIKNYVSEKNEITEYILYNAKKIAYKLGVKFIITPTTTGFTPGRISSLKPTIPIISFTDSDLTFKYCNLMFGTFSHKISSENMEYEKFKKIVGETLQKEYRGKVKSEDKILIVHSSTTTNISDIINGIEIVKFKDL